MKSDSTKVKVVVSSATLRIFADARPRLSSRISRIRNAPTSGRNVTVGENGPVGHGLEESPEHHPGHEPGHADQHRECVVVEIACLQLDDAVGDVEHAGRHTVWAEAVDRPAIAPLPEEAAEAASSDARKGSRLQFVEVPLVEQEGIEPAMLLGQFLRSVGLADVEFVGDQEAPLSSRQRETRRTQRGT